MGGPDACWPWLASKSKHGGPGMFNLNGKRVHARRLAYEWEYGPIQDELEIRASQDCELACMNPAHFRALTKSEGSSLKRGPRTHCNKSHLFTEENTYSVREWRYCIICRIANLEELLAQLLEELDDPILESEASLPDREPVYPELWGGRQRVIGGRVVDDKFERRFYRKVDKIGGPGACWRWKGMWDSGRRYGLFDIFNNKNGKKRTGAHRVAYELEVGPIPEGYVIDHFRCGKKACCNPAHLEPVTSEENTRRVGRRKPFCQRGHPHNEKNSYFTSSGQRHCKACRILSQIAMLKRGGAGRTSKEKGFWDKVDAADGPEACWLWQGPTINPSGYGMHNGEPAHRLAWEYANGQSIPEGLTINHKCRNRLCCNPDHLETVTPEENSRLAAEFRPSRGRPTEERVRAQVDTSGGLDACWIWPGESMRIWYSERRKTVNVRHFIYERKVGPVPSGKWVTTTCGTHACVNYRHLTRAQKTYTRSRGKPAPDSKQLALL